ncbi:hypothetical protein [Kurthia gibsonii]|nr:hypothetical protein [Kurthia gibsonii]MEB7773575.1 hypothetical protein [Kurthia gibsonii]
MKKDDDLKKHTFTKFIAALIVFKEMLEEINKLIEWCENVYQFIITFF